MKKQIFIEGMSCGHCEKHVKEALQELPGVENVNVNLPGKYAIINVSSDIEDSTIKEAIEEAGYDVTAIKNA